MPISSSSKTISGHGSRFRARFSYVFADGVVLTTGPHNVESDAAADALMLANEPKVEAHKSAMEAEATVANDGTIEDKNDATREHIARDYLKKGMREKDPYHAYFKLKKPIEWLQAQGWSPAQIKLRLLITDEQWDAINARYAYLQLDPQTMQGYESIRENDPGKG